MSSLSLAEILALPAAVRATRDSAAIATALSAGRVVTVTTDIGNGTILETLGLEVGNALLDVIGSQPAFRHVAPLLEQGRLRVDSAMVRATLDALVGNDLGGGVIFTQAHSDALKRLAEQHAPVDEFAVRCLIWADNGDYLA